MNYVLIPEWLAKTLNDNGLSLTTALDLNKLSTILSGEEVAIYTLLQKYDIYKAYDELYNLLKGLPTANAINCIKGLSDEVTVQEAYAYNRYYNENDSVEGAYRIAISGANAGEVQSAKLWCKPVLIGTDTLGFIFEVRKENTDVISLYEELFDVLSTHLSSTEIAKTKLYQNYIAAIARRTV